MKNSSNKVLYLAQAAMIRCHLCRTDCCRCITGFWRGTDSFCRSADDPPGIYSGCNPWIVCRMPHRKHTWRCDPA